MAEDVEDGLMRRMRSSDFKTDHDKTAPAAPRLISPPVEMHASGTISR
jgi:hypothetical protein